MAPTTFAISCNGWIVAVDTVFVLRCFESARRNECKEFFCRPESCSSRKNKDRHNNKVKVGSSTEHEKSKTTPPHKSSYLSVFIVIIVCPQQQQQQQQQKMEVVVKERIIIQRK